MPYWIQISISSKVGKLLNEDNLKSSFAYALMYYRENKKCPVF